VSDDAGGFGICSPVLGRDGGEEVLKVLREVVGYLWKAERDSGGVEVEWLGCL